MSKIIKEYFTTGEFANLCGVNKKTLFHYDNIGLFKPKKILENGYRYYSHNQFELFNVISELKRLGMPLKEIKTFIDNRNPDVALDLFQKEKEKIDKEIKELEKLKELMENKISITKAGKNINDEIILENKKEEFFVLSSAIKDVAYGYDIATYADHLKYCINNDLYKGYPVGVMISKENLLNEDFYNYSYYFTEVDNKNIENLYIKPAGLYVTGYIQGYYDKTKDLYVRLIKFINDNNLTIIGYSYEEVLIDECATKNPNEYVIKISIHVS